MNRNWYGGRPWRRLRAVHLNKQPLCVMCEDLGRVRLATVVDHIKPHRGDRVLFYDPSNLQSLCKHCHDSAKQSMEKTGRLRGCDTSGVPLDPLHHWRAR